MPDVVLGDQVLQDLGHAAEVGLVLVELDPVDESGQLLHLLPGTGVVAPQVFRQLLQSGQAVRRRRLWSAPRWPAPKDTQCWLTKTSKVPGLHSNKGVELTIKLQILQLCVYRSDFNPKIQDFSVLLLQ